MVFQLRNNGLKTILMLCKEDKAILKEIRDSDNKTLLSGRDKNGIPFLNHIFRLHKTIFGEACSSCPNQIGGYIQKLKNFNSSKMKNKKTKDAKFALAKGTLIVFAGTSRSYSEANITDEVALEYLAKNPNRASLFAKVPDNLVKLIEAYKKEQEEKALEAAKVIEEAKNAKIEADKLASQKEEDFKKKVDVLITNGFVRVLDKFQKEDKTISVEDVHNFTPEEFDAFLIPKAVVNLNPATDETKTPAPAPAPENIDVKAEEVIAPADTKVPTPDAKAPEPTKEEVKSVKK